MIKVNLARTKVGETKFQGGPLGANPGGGPGGITVTSRSAENQEAAIRLVLIASFTVGLMIFENQNIQDLNQQMQRLQSQVVELESASQAKKVELESVKDVEAQAKEMEDKLKVLAQLSKLRLREVKTLDFMQSSIPEKLWLKDLKFTSEKEKSSEGKFVFKGASVSTEDLTEFVKRLEDSAYLNEVIVIKNQEVPIPSRSEGTMREFEFTAQVEVKQ